MKRPLPASALLVVVSAFALASAVAACGGPAIGVTTPSNAAIAREPAPPVEKTAESATKASLDPLAVDSALEAASVPKVEITPAKELRGKSRGDLDAAMRLLDGASTPEAAVKKITARLGKPTWIENGKKRVWIAKDGKSCHRFALDADGQAEIETAPGSDWRMLSATAQQNACTGEIRKGGL